MNQRLLFWALTCSMAGFIFGFDLIVISGAEKTIQGLWKLSSHEQGIAISSAFWGTVLGSIFGGIPTSKFGRKKTLIIIALLYLVSALGSAFSQELISFCSARFIGGIGVGIATVAAPLFITEISPADRRGRLTGLFQFNIVFGILLAFVSNAVIASTMGDVAWRWMLGVEAIPALVFGILCFSLPESPRWLITRGRLDEGKKILAQISPELSQAELDETATAIARSSNDSPTQSTFSWSRLRIPILLAFFIAFFNQLSGINAIITFAPRIFAMTGLGENAAILQSAGIGVINLTFTLLGLKLIDQIGRRKLLLIGSWGYIVSLGICAWAFFAFAAPFQVGSAAIKVSDLNARTQRTDLTQNDLTKARSELEAARIKLVEISSADGYSGKAVDLPPLLAPEENEKIAHDALQAAGDQSGSGGLLVMVCIFAFIAAHAIGQGTVIWVIISEIFPAKARAFGQSFGSATHWVFAALLTYIFPLAMETFPPSTIFGFFCFMMILQLLWVKFAVPETKGVSLEEMEKTLGIK
ncbi:sugar porter family MFS transporter [Akkermansiaceae bacterium]|nr:sugar porter family MFS transporter [Akkermansiaceae bacterium]